MTTQDLLLEIGCENLPPASIRQAFEQLERDAATLFDDQRLSYEEIYATGSPRRLVLIVRGLAIKQSAQTESVTGPPVARAFDEDGKPTKAALGFAKSLGAKVEQLKTVATERGDYLGFTRRLKVQSSAALLKTQIPTLITGLRFPKMMHWEASGFRFARPIRWIVCLFGKTVVRFNLGGVKSGDVSHIVPWIQSDRIRVRSVKTYLAAIERAGVILDHNTRLKRINSIAESTAKRLGVRLADEPGLFEELTYMLEEPKPLIGEFDRAYLKLPSEVVVTAMRSHQRYVAFLGRRGALVPKFLTFTEGRVGSPATVRTGNEKVLRARLEDALFYWHEDIKTGVDGLADKLKSIVFIEGLGSLGDKLLRMAAIATQVSKLEQNEQLNEETIARAARLSKSDLASEMIKDGKEFTLLQGLIGSYYAREANEPDEIVAAIREQYLPRNPGDAIPATDLGTYLSIADRVDTIVGCFLAGLAPTGSQDPYALRRQANGLLRMLEKRNTRIDGLLETSLTAYQKTGLSVDVDVDEVRDRLTGFFQNRTAQLLKERGFAADIVGAVSKVAWATPAAAIDRVRAIQTVRGDAAFELLVTGVKRVGNILAAPHRTYGADWPQLHEAFLGSGALSNTLRFDVSKFEDAAETELYTEIKRVIPSMEASERAADVKAVFATLSGLGVTIDSYFEHVLVNCPDEHVKTNRHHFLACVFALFSRYADFSQIVEASESEIRSLAG